MKKYFFVCYNFPPEITTTANRISKLIKYLPQYCQIQVLTPVEDDNPKESIIINSVNSWDVKALLQIIKKLRLEKFCEWFFPFWGEPAVFWIMPALFQAIKSIKQNKPDLIVVFMMPYSIGIIGVILKWLTGLPLVLNFDDSPTCDDMHANFYSWVHYRLTLAMEDFYIRQADAVIYVSKRNLDRVRGRQPQEHQSKFYLVRYGADPEDFTNIPINSDDNFNITYTGAMAGWFEFYRTPEEETFIRNIYQAWLKLGRYETAKLDYRSASPMFVGKAVQQVIGEHPEWQGKIKVNIYGDVFPEYVVNRALQNQNLTDIVSVFSPVTLAKSIEIACKSDLLFMTLPARPSCSPPGGRISAKTYEYLMTDRPILAAVSKGENWDYMEDKPGVWLVEPTDISAMKKVIIQLASTKFSGKSLNFDRRSIHPQYSYENIAKQFNKILESLL